MNKAVMDKLDEASDLVDKGHRFSEAVKILDTLMQREEVYAFKPLYALLGNLYHEIGALATQKRPSKSWIFRLRDKFYEASKLVHKMPDTLESKVAKIAAEHPETRQYLVPILKSR
jgi:hypothetical protein